MEVEAPARQGLTLTKEQLVDLTRYHQPAKQLAELHRRGFHRAVLDRDNQVVLEWAHYDAVCRGTVERAKPKVKPPVVKPRR